MNPELHVRRFLEDSQGKYLTHAFGHIRVGLAHYLEYLKLKGKETIQVSPEFINGFREHLYFERNYRAYTSWSYARAVKHFYEYLKSRKVIGENPVRPYRFRAKPLKERHYTDQEILRAYLTGLERKVARRTFREIVLDHWKRLEGILQEHHLKLIEIDRESLGKIASCIDQASSVKRGVLLGRENRTRSLFILKAILRWMWKNGYRSNDPGRGFKYAFSEDRDEPVKTGPVTSEIWQGYLKSYLEDGRTRLRPRTVQNHERFLKQFFLWLAQANLQGIHEITPARIKSYQSQVYAHETWSDRTKWATVYAVKSFMDWLERTDQILANPARKITWPKWKGGLPTRLMSERDVNILLKMPDTRTTVGLRNRAIFELMYSTGARIGEVAGMRLEDINFEQGLLRIQNPKGGPDYQRVVPIGQMALDWVKRYMDEARPQFIGKEGCERLLFLSIHGGAISSGLLNNAMRYYGIKQGTKRLFSSHSWRVTCATGMLRNRADIRHIQEQLGHRSLNSTQIYTRLFPMDLKKVHEATHPREREWRRMQKNF